jgi:protein-L-isoaspartate(D-aspartate) O-methyltransferase
MVASWRNGYAEDCKSLHPGSIPGEASKSLPVPRNDRQGVWPLMTDFAAIRRNMVDTQLRTYDVNSKRVLDAVDLVGREHFVPEAMVGLAYVDQTISIASGEGSIRTLLQPMVLARMIQSAEIQSDNKVLSIAGGTGYGAALMAAMGCNVTLLEASEGLAVQALKALAAAQAQNISVVSGDLLAGQPSAAPFDVIIVEGALETEPKALLAQLADGGRLVCVMGRGRAGRVTVFQRSGNAFGGKSVFDAAAAMLETPASTGFRF